MSTTNTYGDLSPRTAGYAVRKLLERGQYAMVLERFGQTDPQGQHKTKTRKWRRYLSLPAAIAPLAEGISPAGQRLSYVDVTATLEQYGDMVKVSDVVMDTHEDPVLNETVKILGEQAAETVELLRFNVLKGGTNVYYPGTATTRETVNSPVTRAVLRQVVRGFSRNKARRISEIVKASAKISTEPVASAYFAVCHTDLDSDIRGVVGFVPVEQYSNSDKAIPNEIGKVENIRFVTSALLEPWLAAATSSSGSTYLTNGASGTGYPDVYPILVFARDAYAIVPLQGKNSVSIAVVNPKPVHGDELGQSGFASWKTYQTGAILNQLWMARVEVACTATPA
ncbi:MAG: N4-gp56 family major capsid protein [Kiritimatiellae bacterium]|nr:N4-gp56 family major capsid protein [Dehalococcoidia bacterium]MDD3546352.1 N4-gp56 family major capsid protein [Kiritimatiellia bacterium]